MLIKRIKSENFITGEMEEKEFRFHLSKPEILDLEFESNEKLTEKIKVIIAKKDTDTIYRIFKELICKSYGEVSEDGSRFIKIDSNGNPLYLNFLQTDAYSQMFDEMLSSETAITEFIKGILPKGFTESEEYKNAEKQTKKELEKLMEK